MEKAKMSATKTEALFTGLKMAKLKRYTLLTDAERSD